MTRRSRSSADGPAVPLYVITGGEAGQGGEDEAQVLDLVTLVVARPTPPGHGAPGGAAGLRPELAAIRRMCARPLSVAEISAYLQLPFSVVSVLVGELLAAGLVRVRQTRAQQRQEAAEPDIATLKALIDGLQRL